MALHIKLEGDILEVVESIHSFHNTRKTYWYYNVREWKRSITGYQNAVVETPMTDREIQWVKDHYLPKVN